MSGRLSGDPHALLVPGASPLHRAGAAAKLVGATAFVTVVAVTPRYSVMTFAVAAVVVGVVVALARLSFRLVLARLVVIVPFLVVALVMPWVAHGPRVEVAGTSLSVDGLWAAWNTAAKSVLGATAAIVVVATTRLTDLLDGLVRLRVPRVVVAMVASMLRYMELTGRQLSRRRRAMLSRGHDPRWLWQAAPVATSLGTLFVRSYERGERVHRAMSARGFTGTVPEPEGPGPTRLERAVALVPAVLTLVALWVWWGWG